MFKPLLLATALTLFFFSTASARTWYVAADSTGDAPTIEAAVDSSGAGDAILVGPGTYLIRDFELKPHTTLRSESGPAVTTLLPYDGPYQVGMVSLFDGCAITGFRIAAGSVGTIGANGNNIEISGNIIEDAPQTITIFGVATVHHNVILGPIYIAQSEGLNFIYNNIILGQIADCGAVFAYCNDITIPTSCVTYGGTNFNLDPMFCGPDNYYLHAASPCAPGNHPNGYDDDCGLIGPLPVACGTVSVEEKTWGAVKALYR